MKSAAPISPFTPGPGGPGTPAWHALSAEEVVGRLSASRDGLSSEDASARLARFGPNALPGQRRRSALAVFLAQFRSPLIYLLIVAAAIALATGDRRDAAVIVGVLLVNAAIGAFQEGRAQRSMEELRRLAALRARVLRDGEERSVEARDLVPGDLLLLAAGDAVTADARLLSAASLRLLEAPLTGESVPVPKKPDEADADAPPAERHCMVYAGTHVAAGRGRAVVVSTGAGTEVGRIATLAESAPDLRTPLERRLAQLGRYLALAAIGVFAIVLAAGLLRGLSFSAILMVAMSQLVSTVPEGLPVAMTVALAVGMRRMAERRAIVRRLAAVETLGSTTVICTDKTGTLTRNEMTAVAVRLPDGRALAVEGAGYGPEGRILEGGREVRAGGDAQLRRLLEAAVLCNDAGLVPPESPGDRWRARGDPTEAALLALASKGGLDPAATHAAWPRRDEIPFHAEQRMMATLHESAGASRVIVKGAPEAVLELAGWRARPNGTEPLTPEERALLAGAAEVMAGSALRVLAFAEASALPSLDGSFEALRGKAILLGFVGELDPPREEAHEAVRLCRSAGIRTVMITGDHKATGVAVAGMLEIVSEGDRALDGRELAATPEAALRAELPRISVFARVQPEQKLRIVEALQASGEVVAVTGDGVNDAPALARADVGVAMGLSGTEVAKEASEIVVTDDNFATIVRAVHEGRVVYRNLQKALLLLLSTGIAEIAVLLLALLAGLPLPFVAVQILWNNVVTEGTITVNLGMEPPEGDEMHAPPIPRGGRLVAGPLLRRMLVMSAVITGATLGYFAFRLGQGVPLDRARTGTFTLLAVCEWFNVLNCRSRTRSALRLDVRRNRWLTAGLAVSVLLQAAVLYWTPLAQIFHVVPLAAGELAAIVAVGSLVLWAEELRKALARRGEGRIDGPQTS